MILVGCHWFDVLAGDHWLYLCVFVLAFDNLVTDFYMDLMQRKL